MSHFLMEWLPWLITAGALLVAVRTAVRCGRAEERMLILATLLDGVLSVEPDGDGTDTAQAVEAGNGSRPAL